MALLEYESQMFAEIVAEDGFLIAAKGLGLDNVIIKLLELYNDPGTLVLVLNMTPSEETYFIEELEMTDAAKHRLPVLLTNEFTSKERLVRDTIMTLRAKTVAEGAINILVGMQQRTQPHDVRNLK
ncbi:DNA repair endonuclease XPF-like [Corticium candelabrum]|uniref:DNA repair endonuclease XPF-like n=1 Tax=Corticium candelabrum TaxID=121492 RepID=UPI002E25A3EE|nr:DNA repair endonuclease XPF-like [Corticium candelabrum]